jgi:hypothetical protein
MALNYALTVALKISTLSLANVLDQRSLNLAWNAGAPAIGRAAITATAQGFMTAFPDMVVKMDEVQGDGSHATFRWLWTGTNTGPGGKSHKVRISGFEKWRMGRDGLIASSQGHFDAAEYRRQLERGS